MGKHDNYIVANCVEVRFFLDLESDDEGIIMWMQNSHVRVLLQRLGTLKNRWKICTEL